MVISETSQDSSFSNENLSQQEQWSVWAAEAQGGDKRSYNFLLRDITPFIRNTLVSGLSNPEWADDITQEVLISVHKAFHSYSPDRPFRPWLNAIISYRRADYLRKHYRNRKNMQTSLDDPEFLKNHVTGMARAGEYKDIAGALEALPEKQRRLFRLMKIEGHSAKEAASEMNMTESAVKVSVHRAIVKLKERLG